MGEAGRLLSSLHSSIERATNLLQLRYAGWIGGGRLLHLDKQSGGRTLQITIRCPVPFADVVERIERDGGLLGSPLYLLRDGTRVSGYPAQDAV